MDILPSCFLSLELIRSLKIGTSLDRRNHCENISSLPVLSFASTLITYYSSWWTNLKGTSCNLDDPLPCTLAEMFSPPSYLPLLQY